MLASINNKSWSADAVHFGSIAGQISILPHLNYSDISGLKAKYLHPTKNLRFSNKKEYQMIENMTPMEVREFLSFRGVVKDPVI